MVINRNTLQQLAEIRFKEAKLLFDNGMYDGAYYLSGYVIELALKARYAKNIQQHDFPDKDIVNKIFIHDLDKLKGLVSLTADYERDIKITPKLDVNWTVVGKWKEDSRYQKHNMDDAKKILDAISDPNGGVFLWLKKYW